MNEFSISWLKGSDYAEVTAPTGSKLKNKIIRWAEDGKAGVEVKCVNQDGSIFAHIPVSFVHIGDRKKRAFSEEQRAVASKRLSEWRMRKASEEAETFDDLPFMGLKDWDDDGWEDDEWQGNEIFPES